MLTRLWRICPFQPCGIMCWQDHLHMVRVTQTWPSPLASQECLKNCISEILSSVSLQLKQRPNTFLRELFCQVTRLVTETITENLVCEWATAQVHEENGENDIEAQHSGKSLSTAERIWKTEELRFLRKTFQFSIPSSHSGLDTHSTSAFIKNCFMPQ